MHGVHCNLYRPRCGGIYGKEAEEVKKYFNDKLYTAVIPRNVRLSEAPSYGMPIFEYDRFCKGAMAYKAVGEEFLRKNAGEQP